MASSYRSSSIGTELGREQRGGHLFDLVTTGVEILDSINLGVVVVSATGQLLLTNRTADLILDSRDGLHITPQGMLDSMRRAVGARLRAAIRQAGTSAEPDKACAQNVLAIERSSGKRPLTLLVRSVSKNSSTLDVSRPVLLLMLDPEGPIQATETSLRQLYGFTAREARLAHLLISDKSLDECCSVLNIQPSTARMHLGNLYAKTGVQRQSQLVSLLLKSVWLVCMTTESRTRNCADAVEVHGRTGRFNHQSSEVVAAALEALDLLDIGIGVTSTQNQLLYANRTAHKILAAHDGREVTAEGALRILRKGNSRAGQAATTQRVETTLKPTNRLVAAHRRSGKRPLVLLIRSVVGNGGELNPGGVVGLTFMLDPDLPIPATEYGLREMYGFTACEARLANLLMDGMTLDSCCTRLEICESTARMHLAHMFAKTGVQRQSQLISLLWKSISIVRVKDDEELFRPVLSCFPFTTTLVRSRTRSNQTDLQSDCCEKVNSDGTKLSSDLMRADNA